MASSSTSKKHLKYRSRRRLAAISFLSNISLDGTFSAASVTAFINDKENEETCDLSYPPLDKKDQVPSQKHEGKSLIVQEESERELIKDSNQHPLDDNVVISQVSISTTVNQVTVKKDDACTKRLALEPTSIRSPKIQRQDKLDNISVAGKRWRASSYSSGDKPGKACRKRLLHLHSDPLDRFSVAFNRQHFVEGQVLGDYLYPTTV